MSTPLLDPFRFANIRASLLHHGSNDLQEHKAFGATCSSINGEIFRAFKLDQFGRANPADWRATPDLGAAKANLVCAVTAAVFDWQRANWSAHTARYEETTASPLPKLPKGNVLGIPALLKALIALRYNCDGGAASGSTVQASLVILDRLIDLLKDQCLEMLPEFQAAEWAI
jgi:hypothetical protein